MAGSTPRARRATTAPPDPPGARPDPVDPMSLTPRPTARDPRPRPDRAVLDSIVGRAFAQTLAMIHVANHRQDKRRGDPKVGGHPASCASSAHILGALHLVARRVHDYVCCKPHAAPLDHSFHHLMQVFRDERSGTWLDEERSKALMHTLRAFPEPGVHEHVFQSYHARSDPDSFHFLPSGSVGIPPVVSVYLALAHRYARDHGYEVPPRAHFWSLIGDSEFREGSLLEALPDVAERQLGNVTWIIDYNRQNLDGTRIPNPRGLRASDCERIERTALANGWRVIQVRHGRHREEVFARPGGEALRSFFEQGVTDYEYQLLLFRRDPADLRQRILAHAPQARALLDGLSDEGLLRVLDDIGGHCIESLVEALERSRLDPDEPFLVIAHTIKGWSLRSAAHPANHSALPSDEEMEEVLARAGLSWDDPFARFAEGTPEAEHLALLREEYRAGIEEHLQLGRRNRAKVREAIEAGGGLPETIGIDLSLFPLAHTQWMWGQLAAKLVRVGSQGQPIPDDKAGAGAALNENEARWAAAAQFVLTLSPDVGTSTNISPAMDKRIYGPDVERYQAPEFDIQARHPGLVMSDDPWTRHIRFEIAEANCMSAAGAFGRMAHYTGLPFFPMMTVYDFFIKRALDQLYYNLYWGAEFVLMGTPSGVTLSPEGAQHSWKSDIQIPNLVTWEPLFAIEMDWILSDAMRRQMLDENEGRRGVLIRAVTRAIPQGLLLENLRRQVRFKRPEALQDRLLAPKGSDVQEGGTVHEDRVASRGDSEILEALREDCLAGGYRLVDWRGYAGYEPGDNVVNVFAMGSVATEALDAAGRLLERGLFANVIVISSPELLLGILGHRDGYRHLREGLGVDGHLYLDAREAVTEEAGLVSLAGRRVPCVAVCDGEAGLLDNIGSIVGVRQETLAVRKFTKCGRPDQVYGYLGLDADAIVEACGKVLSETALEDLRVSREVLETLALRQVQGAAVRDWRELWPSGSDRKG